MEIRKERNLFVAVDGTKVKGQYDSTTGIFYGAKGTPIQSTPSAFKNTIYSYIFTSHQWIISHTDGETRARALARWEQLASLGLYTPEHDILTDENYNFPALKKDLVKYVKDHGNSIYSKKIQKQYDITCVCPEYALLNDDYLEAINELTTNRELTFPIEWGIRAMFRLQVEDAHYVITSIWDLVDLINEYYCVCTLMKREPAITKNFLITIAHTMHLYKVYENEQLDNLIKQHNDIPELYYENDTYIVRPLLNHDEFHAEAEAQHNCVERMYMQRVAKGITHVVVVRKKDAPDNSLVTCEITNTMEINQYYARYNYTPDRAEMLFCKELEAYLKNIRENKA